MKITLEEKNRIFSILEDNFSWCTIENVRKNFYRDFHDRGYLEDNFEIYSGAVKYCICSELFNGYVVKFCYEDFDYCEREYTNYLAAIEHNLDVYFPFTDYLGNINGIKFFVQEYAICNEEEITSIWYEKIRESYESDGEDEDEISDEIWAIIDDMEDDEGISLLFNCDELLSFLSEYRINDLHQGNFGYINDKLVIIDFSGFGARAKGREF